MGYHGNCPYCWGCKREFPAGTEMEVSTDIDKGKVIHAHWCIDCVCFILKLPADEAKEGFEYGGLLNYEDYRDKIFNKENRNA